MMKEMVISMKETSTISKVVIIGNGFDLHHGLKTSYQDFTQNGLSTEKKEKLKRFAKELNLDNEALWYDFEEIFRKIIIDKGEKLQEKGGLSKANAIAYRDEIKEINVFFHSLMHDLQNYLKNITNDKNEKKYIVDTNIADVLNEADIILTFNYTSTLVEIYQVESDKIIHVHGKLEGFPIFGHSNFIGYDSPDANYMTYYFSQGLSEIMNSGNVEQIDVKTGNITPPNYQPEPVEPIINVSNHMYGDKNIQRLIMMASDMDAQKKRSNITMSKLEDVYNNPFSPFPKEFGFKNQLQLKFAQRIEINVIGHGLQSDVDFLSKIPIKNKIIRIFNGPNYIDDKLENRATKVFSVGTEEVITVEYSR